MKQGDSALWRSIGIMLKYFNCSSLVTVWCKQQQTFSYYFASHVFSSLSPSFSRFRGPQSVILQQSTHIYLNISNMLKDS